MTDRVRKVSFCAEDRYELEKYLSREWLVSNGLGGYSSGTVVGVPTRRYHGLLVASHSQAGRVMMLNNLLQRVCLADGSVLQIGCEEKRPEGATLTDDVFPTEFRLERGVPVWRYEIADVVLERRILMPNRQNSVHVTYDLLSAKGAIQLQLAPAVHFRQHQDPVSTDLPAPYPVILVGNRVDIADPHFPTLRLIAYGGDAKFVLRDEEVRDVFFRVEARRGYESEGKLWSPGYFEFTLCENRSVTLVASTEEWDTILALPPEELLQADEIRRDILLAGAQPLCNGGIGAELVLGADQFVISPSSRPADAARAHAAGEELHSVIAGYHWFTDWGRDTMISLEGLTLVTGRHTEAGWILRTFAHYVKDGLVPNMFPEGANQGRYNTADASLWFLHAVDRYLDYTNDRTVLMAIFPKLVEILRCQIRGTDFGIRVDPGDGLLTQGAPGLQLTWMDAKVGDWVVTPRRGKAVEINALWYNALRLMERWLREREGDAAAREPAELAARVYDAFNRRFWNSSGGYLFDVVDGESGNDPSCRPNQVFSIALPNPVLDPSHWGPVMKVVEDELLTPVGLRSLSRDHPDYRPIYDGDLRARDAAYHQGTVWAWLIGPFIDAWLKLHPDRKQEARKFLGGLVSHLDEACIGSISEVFDAEPPFTPRGCIAQAWSVAEALRLWAKTVND